MSKKDNPYDLTEAEVAFLRGSTVAPEVRNYLARQHENLGTKTTSFQKVAAAANAEADAMLAVKRLDGVRGEAVEVAELQAAVESRDKQINGLSAVRTIRVPRAPLLASLGLTDDPGGRGW